MTTPNIVTRAAQVLEGGIPWSKFSPAEIASGAYWASEIAPLYQEASQIVQQLNLNISINPKAASDGYSNVSSAFSKVIPYLEVAVQSGASEISESLQLKEKPFWDFVTTSWYVLQKSALIHGQPQVIRGIFGNKIESIKEHADSVVLSLKAFIYQYKNGVFKQFVKDPLATNGLGAVHWAVIAGIVAVVIVAVAIAAVIGLVIYYMDKQAQVNQMATDVCKKAVEAAKKEKDPAKAKILLGPCNKMIQLTENPTVADHLVKSVGSTMSIIGYAAGLGVLVYVGSLVLPNILEAVDNRR